MAIRPCCAARASPLTLLAGILLAGHASLAHPQSQHELPGMVVTATGFEQELSRAPASISVVTREELESRPYRDLAEALQNVEGIDVQGGTGKTGGLDISIRGLPSEYTLILIDGRRQNVAGDVTPNGFGTAHTSFLPPVSAIERIEIIRGPMSTLYGSDAMGGVVNIITRKVASTWQGSIGAQVGIPESSAEGGQRRFDLYVNGPLVQDRLGIALRGSFYDRDAFDRMGSGTGRDPRPGDSRQTSAGARLTFTPDKANEFWLDIEQAHTRYDNSDCRLGTVDYINCATGAPTTTASGYEDELEFNREQIALGHASRLGFGRLESSVTHSRTETLGRTLPSASFPAGDPAIGTARKLETTNLVVDTRLVAPLGSAHLLTVGGQWWDAEFTDGLLPRDYSQTMWALFAEDEWSITEDLSATIGGRYNHHDAFGGEVSPRAYLVWSASPHLTIKGGVSGGFRAPRLNQLIDGANGITGQGTIISIGNPTLKPEKSVSTELGLSYDPQNGTSSSVTLFHNRIKDRISSGGDCATHWISSCAANPTATYATNIDEGKTWGLEFSNRTQLAERLALNVSYTWTDSEAIVDGRKSGKLSDTARHLASMQLRYDLDERWSFWLRGEYRGKSRRFDGDPAQLTGNSLREHEALGDLRGHALFHVGASWKATRNLDLGASIYNLFDKEFDKFRTWTDTGGNPVLGNLYYRSAQSTKGTAPAGRTLWLTARLSF